MNASPLEPGWELAEHDLLRSWWVSHMGDMLELLLGPQLDTWLRRARAGASAEAIALDPQLSPRDVRDLLELWTFRDALRRQRRRGVD